MKKYRSTLEQRLIAAGQGHMTNETFVRSTMQKIRRTSASESFNAVLNTPRPAGASLLQKLRRLPKLVATSLGIGAVVLTAGTAYAAYSLWLSPTARVRSVVQQYGRDQALIDLKNCERPNQKTDVEITKNSSGTANDAAKSLAAHCELEAIQSWAMQRFHEQPSQVSFAMTVIAVSPNSLAVKDAQNGQTHTYPLTNNTPFAFQGNIVPQSAIKVGDTIALVIGSNVQTLNAVVKLSFSPNYYVGSDISNTYHERQGCIGNTDASCIALPMLDVLRSGEGGANSDSQGAPHQIQGKLTSLSPTGFTLRATSGKTYAVHTDSDVIGIFNASNPYGSVSIGLGDVLDVMYSVPAGGNTQTIQPTQYHQIELLLQGFDKQAREVTSKQKYHY